ncbi:MAG: class I SAM-dependent methyltransferase, partial [Candidatus Brocadiae bacterium]|nr:class I SAM-dependent methyltransferase [Candidatus Brocadiia bacterium]
MYDNMPGWVDGTAQYLALVSSFVRDGDRVLDVGPGGGDTFSHTLKGRAMEIVGLDPDERVLHNPTLDRAIVGYVERIPVPDSSFDAAVSSFAIEHIEDPEAAARELFRVLRPAGCFVFRTPNLWHYATIVSRLTPHWLHEKVANWVRGLPSSTALPQRTLYRCNTLRSIRRTFLSAGFS